MRPIAAETNDVVGSSLPQRQMPLHRLLEQGRPMTISTRLALGISAAALSLSLGVTSAALAQDAMIRDLEFRNSLSRRDTTSTDTIAKDTKDHGRRWGPSFIAGKVGVH